VPRTFAFVDLSGFTNYTAAFGDDAAGRLLSAFRGITRDVASDRGVRIAKWLGDGCMIVAINQADCISFAIELEAKASQVCAPLSLRIGMATGHALLFEGDDYIGSAVNLASRLCDCRWSVRGADPVDAARAAAAGRARDGTRWHRAARLPR